MVHRRRLKTILAQTSTTLTLAEVRYDTEVPDELFDPTQLPNIATHPIWHEANLIAHQKYKISISKFVSKPV